MAVPTKPLPSEFNADELDQPFWDAAAQHRLVVHQCKVCKRRYWPASSCVQHGDKDMEWVPVSGRAKVYTYTVFHRPFLIERQKEVPYNVAVVELEEGPLMFTNIVGCANSDIKIGMSVRVVWEDVQPGVTLPKFSPA